MSNTTTPNLGIIIPSGLARRIIYGAFVLALVLAGAIQAYDFALGLTNPDWLTGALGVLAYLGIPVGSLALANAPQTSAE